MPCTMWKWATAEGMMRAAERRASEWVNLMVWNTVRAGQEKRCKVSEVTSPYGHTNGSFEVIGVDQ